MPTPSSGLVEHQVDFVLIGGLAVAVHGYPRGTKAVDVVSREGRENAERLFAALTAIGARPLEMGDLRQEEMPVDFDIDGLALGGNWALRTERGRVDVMAWVPGIGGYDELTGDSILIEMREVGVVRVAGIATS